MISDSKCPSICGAVDARITLGEVILLFPFSVDPFVRTISLTHGQAFVTMPRRSKQGITSVQRFTRSTCSAISVTTISLFTLTQRCESNTAHDIHHSPVKHLSQHPDNHEPKGSPTTSFRIGENVSKIGCETACILFLLPDQGVANYNRDPGVVTKVQHQSQRPVALKCDV